MNQSNNNNPKDRNERKENESRQRSAKQFHLSDETLRQYQFVCSNGATELVDQMNSGWIKISKAFKIQKEKEYRQKLHESSQGKNLPSEEKCKLYNEDFHNFISPQDNRIEKETVKLIFTDIEYKKESIIRLCPGLFSLAIKVLPKGGSLMTYAGQYSIPLIIRYLDEVNSKIEDPQERLSWFWMSCVKHTGRIAKMQCQKLKVNWKPLLWFVKGATPRRLNEFEYIDDFLEIEVDDYVESESPEKELHEWAQSPVEAEYYIKHLTNEGDIVLDCMMGSGTTAVPSLNLDRRFIGIEINTERFQTGKDRIIRDTGKTKNEY
jgi:site-specific DNA-methyltransferase (adenine-specific)